MGRWSLEKSPRRLEIFKRTLVLILTKQRTMVNRLIIIIALLLYCSISVAHPDKGERRKARQEHRLSRERFDNRTPKQKRIDTKVLSVVAIIAIIFFKKADDTL